MNNNNIDTKIVIETDIPPKKKKKLGKRAIV
jgi:hypothetical protein